MSTPPTFTNQTHVYVLLTKKGEEYFTDETRHTGGPSVYHVRDNVYKMTLQQVFFFFSRKMAAFSGLIVNGEMSFEEPTKPTPDA